MGKDSLAYYEKILLPSHPKIAKIKSFMGSLYIKMDKMIDAKKMLLQAYDHLKSHYESVHYELLPTLERLIRLYSYTNQDQKTRRYKQEKEIILKKICEYETPSDAF